MRTTVEIVADLRETADSFERDDWHATAEQIREAADRLAELDAEVADMRDGLASYDRLVEAYRNTSDELKRLAAFIIEHVSGEPSESQGAVDCAIRLLTDRDARLTAVNDALDQYDRDARSPTLLDGAVHAFRAAVAKAVGQ